MLRVNPPLILPSTANSKILRLRTRLVSGFAISSTTASVVFSVHWIASILKFKIVQFFQNYSSVFRNIFHNLTVASNSISNTNMTFDVSISNDGLVAVENSLPLISITRFGEPTGTKLNRRLWCRCVRVCMSVLPEHACDLSASCCHWRLTTKNSFFIKQCRWVNLYFLTSWKYLKSSA